MVFPLLIQFQAAVKQMLEGENEKTLQEVKMMILRTNPFRQLKVKAQFWIKTQKGKVSGLVKVSMAIRSATTTTANLRTEDTILIRENQQRIKQ